MGLRDWVVLCLKVSHIAQFTADFMHISWVIYFTILSVDQSINAQMGSLVFSQLNIADFSKFGTLRSVFLVALFEVSVVFGVRDRRVLDECDSRNPLVVSSVDTTHRGQC